MSKQRTYDPNIWMPFYIGDTLADTQTLTCVEFGALVLIRSFYWRNQGPILNDDKRLALVCKLSIEEYRSLKESIFEYFQQQDDKLVSKELDELITEAWENKERASERGKKGAEARWGNKGDNWWE